MAPTVMSKEEEALQPPDDARDLEEASSSSSIDGREQWKNPAEFVLTLIGFSVGLGNIWRFPYLCMRNGGGAFLIPYFLFLFLCGMPLFYMEVAIGQYSGLSALKVWKLAPIFQGVGYGMVMVSGIIAMYYNTILTWILYYLFSSFTTNLPWGSCNNHWNTEACRDNTYNITSINGTNSNTSFTNVTANITQPKWTSPAEEFWNENVLELSDGIHDMGGFRWQLVLLLMLSWVIMFLCLSKGIKTVGKVVYVTATLPYLFLSILLVRGLTLNGSVDGILLYLTPQWHRLTEFKVWGGLICMASYNKFNNNALRDTFLVCFACSGTSFLSGFVIFSILGFMAADLGVPVDKFGMLETLISGVVDSFPAQLQERKTLFTGFVCTFMFIMGLPFVSRGGMYLFQIFEWYSSSFAVVVIAFSECICIAYVYGVRRLSKDIELMLGAGPNMWFKVCWCVITPAITMTIIIFSSYQMSTAIPNVGHYFYPSWALVVGWAVAMVSIIPIPGCALLSIIREKGTFIERLHKVTKPAEDWGPISDTIHLPSLSPKLDIVHENNMPLTTERNY